MRPTRRLPGNVLAAIAGALVGGLLVLSAEGLTRPSGREHELRSPLEPAPPNLRLSASGPTVLLAWAPGGLPPRTERIFEATRGVIDATTVRVGQDWLSSSRLADGSKLDDPPAGMKIPIDAAVIEPAEYAQFVSPGERDAILSLGRREAVLAETEAELRGAGEGLRMRFGNTTLRASGVISDLATNGYEMLTRGPVPARWGRTNSYVLAHIRPRARDALIARLDKLAGGSFTSKLQGETPFLRKGDAVLPQMLIKKHFGEFAARSMPDGTLEVDPRWRENNIVRVRVPVLGEVMCHRTFVPQLRSALRSAVAQGLAYTLDGGYGGCYFARFIGYDPRGWLSNHSWGVAIDINVSENLHGTKADQDERLVTLLGDHGFAWGGGWVVPDGMHFEFLRFP